MGTIIQEAIRTAVEKGYRVDDRGQVMSPSGKLRKLGVGSHTGGRAKYYVFNICDTRGKRVPIPVHRFAMYQRYGEESFKEEIVVRHRDCDSLNNKAGNLALGTHSENHMDEPKELRVERARHAASFLRKLSPEDVACLRRDRARGATYAQLGDRYGVVKSTVANIVKGRLYRDCL